ncbi:MAG: hypothetical protein H7Z17_21160, partial [Fuerstia sp.]|nr:hypothetical protein [Fuerstiella sp.]
MSFPITPQNSAARQELSIQHRIIVLAAAFLGWMFAGLQIALFVLIHRPAMISLMSRGSSSDPA